MYKLALNWTLAILKAPPEPHPPIGDPASLRVFRAGKNYFRLRIAGWALAELAAFAGLIFWTVFLVEVGRIMHEERQARANRTVPILDSAHDSADTKSAAADQLAQIRHDRRELNGGAGNVEKKTTRKHTNKPKYESPWEGFKHAGADLALRLPAGAFALIWTIKIFSALAFLVQLPITYAVRRLDYEMRWYMVTDRSLRLRYGVWQIAESTMSFANIQQVVVSQGPLQRLLGLGDVQVKSAGGGGGGGNGHQSARGADDMHTGMFHSVTNGEEIRDLILERLRRFREAGLGDPDEQSRAVLPVSNGAKEASVESLAAARELVAEARALRAALSRS